MLEKPHVHGHQYRSRHPKCGRLSGCPHEHFLFSCLARRILIVFRGLEITRELLLYSYVWCLGWDIQRWTQQEHQPKCLPIALHVALAFSPHDSQRVVNLLLRQLKFPRASVLVNKPHGSVWPCLKSLTEAYPLFLLVEAVPNLSRFKDREHKPYPLREEVSKNLQSYFKTATPSPKEDNPIPRSGRYI